MNLRKLSGMYRWLRWDIALVIVAVIFAGVMVQVASTRPLTSLEGVLFQFTILGAGLFGSYRFGQSSAAKAARDVVRPHARSALRTILSLRDSLVRLSSTIEEFRADNADSRLDIIQAVIHEQIPMGRSAVEDWRDIVPDDVDEVLKQWPEQREV